MPHRRNLLRQLEEYAERHPERATEAAAITHFVESTPHCFERTHTAGHITGSAWLLNPTGDKALLTLHAKLGRWLQPGGHADGDAAPLRVALREAEEESGICGITPVSADIYDVDIHEIPARGNEPAHLHYDIRYLLRAPHEHHKLSAESQALAWVSPTSLHTLQPAVDTSVLRLARQNKLQ